MTPSDIRMSIANQMYPEVILLLKGLRQFDNEFQQPDIVWSWFLQTHLLSNSVNVWIDCKSDETNISGTCIFACIFVNEFYMRV